ncbi:hypothetical protein M758_UG081900 [Ceratodon purpureus]|nr:hypothetical protein M758_UG081900 [Ceratodon purpureus]
MLVMNNWTEKGSIVHVLQLPSLPDFQSTWTTGDTRRYHDSYLHLLKISCRCCGHLLSMKRNLRCAPAQRNCSHPCWTPVVNGFQDPCCLRPFVHSRLGLHRTAHPPCQRRFRLCLYMSLA